MPPVFCINNKLLTYKMPVHTSMQLFLSLLVVSDFGISTTRERLPVHLLYKSLFKKIGMFFCKSLTLHMQQGEEKGQAAVAVKGRGGFDTADARF